MDTSSPQDKYSIQEKINPQLQYKDQIEKFFQNLQKGDLGLSKLILYGFIIYGDTRAGKTALAHVLSKSSIRGVKKNGQFMVVPTTTKNFKFAIGNTMNSQTLVPNNFQVNLKGRPQKFNLIDTPGYGDTNGMLTILANGYYHYRLYSKVQNMKFIICFDSIQLNNTAVEFINVIKQWTNSFADYLQVKKEIWKSVAFIITKVEDKPTIKQDLIEKLKNIAKDMRTLYEKNVEEAIKQLIQYIIKEERVFYVKKIKEGETLVEGDLIERIDKKISHWWTRDYNKQKQEVDMSKVTFALSQQIIESITRYPMCKRQYSELISYYNLRIKEFIKISGAVSDGKDCSLASVIQQLVEDAMGHPDSHKFIEVMKNYNNLYYTKYDESYNEERSKLQEELFGNGNKDNKPQKENKDNQSQKGNKDNQIANGNKDNQKKMTQQKLTKQQLTKSQLAQQSCQKNRRIFKGKDKNYQIKKFKCLKKIQQLKEHINAVKFDERDIESIEQCATIVYKIITEFKHISFKKSFSSKIIYKYGYIIHRIIEEAKIFTLLIQIYGKDDKQKIMDLTGGEFIELIRPLIDFMGLDFKYNKMQVTYQDLNIAFIKKFNYKDLDNESLLINEDLVNFFSQADIQLLQEEDVDKLTQVVLKYSDKVLEDAEKQLKIILDQSKGKLIRKLTITRQNCDQSYVMKNTTQEKNYFLFTIRKSSKNLAKLLELLGQYKLSRSVYDTIRFVDSVCKLYRLEINLMRKPNLINKDKNQENRKREFDLRIQFSNYLANHFRQHQAIEVLQQNFQLAENIAELNKVKDQLSNMKLKIKEQQSTDYQKKLFNEQFFDPLSDKLVDQILDYSHRYAILLNNY